MIAIIDITKLKYKLVLTTETGRALDITKATTDLGWEEGEKEIAMRTTFTVHNSRYKGERLSSIAKLGCLITVMSSWGGGDKEVARGTIQEWEPEQEGSKNDNFRVLAYDELFNLQQSQDNRYYAAGTGTKTAIEGIFKDWSIPVEKYEGPDVAHAKTLYKNDYLSDILIQLLKDAEKKGGPKCIIRASKGKVSVIPKGSNKEIYHFSEDKNTKLAKDKMSIVELVTRVKVVGKEDSEGRQPVEAVLDGLTQYGIRQTIQNRSQDDTLATAKSAAKDVLDEYGKPIRTTVIEAPDVPTVRKGDKIHVEAGALRGYFITKSVRHDAANRTMTMEIEPAEETKVAGAAQTAAASSGFERGDSVILNGPVYRDSYGNGQGATFKDRACKITIKVDTARPCPYHVDAIGWVKPGSIKKA